MRYNNGTTRVHGVPQGIVIILCEIIDCVKIALNLILMHLSVYTVTLFNHNKQFWQYKLKP